MNLFIAALGGFIVMGLELLAPRLVAPHFGTAIYSWAAAISFSLLALSFGYWLGDRYARRAAPHGIVIFGGTALWIAVIALMRGPAPALFGGLDLRVAVFAYSALLLIPPLALLAMVGPIVIARGIVPRPSGGISAGRVFAVSTLGSFLGALLTGLWLIPSFTLTAILLLFLGLALLGALLSWPRGNKTNLAAGIAAGLALGGIVWITEPAEAALFHSGSAYGEIAVFDRTVNGQGMRFLTIDGISQSFVYPATSLSPAAYLYYLLAPAAEPADAPRRALVIGLGAGLLPGLLEQYGWKVDSVEINPAVLRAARDFFHFNGNAVVADGRQYLAAGGPLYDYIVVDAYSANEIPWHLYTREALAAAKGRLKPGGLLAYNTMQTDDDGSATFTASFAAAAQGIFANATAIDIVAPRVAFNRLFYFHDGSLAGQNAIPLERDTNTTKFFAEFAAQPRQVLEFDARPLTDDWAPVSELCQGAARNWRNIDKHFFDKLGNP